MDPHVERAVPADRGSFAVLTKEGQEALNTTWPVYAQCIARYFANHLDDAEKRVIATALGRIRDRAGDEPSAVTARQAVARR